jgi:glycosyltransferase involved in cell wall biosynthesis
MLPKPEVKLWNNDYYEICKFCKKERRRSMKIGIDCRLWSETGVGRYIRNLVLNLQKIDKKNEYCLFVLSKDKDEILKLVQNGRIKIIRADIRWHTLEEQLKFPSLLNKENLDLMHFPYFAVPVLYGRPFIITIHDLITDHYSTGHASTLPIPFYYLKKGAYKLVINMAAKKARKIIAVSNATKNDIVDRLKISPQKIVVTYEGVDDKISNLKLQIPNIFQNSKYFLYVGNAFPHKNLDRLIEAFKILDADMKLVLVGKEDYFYKRLKNQIKEMDLSEKVIFLKNVDDKELSSLYRNAQALILPSLMEGFGLPALEAMANNCLVLASKIPALEEVCGDAAIYFDPRNIQDIAEKINMVHLSDANHYDDKREKGLKRAKLFSWSKMAKETLEVYESCVCV